MKPYIDSSMRNYMSEYKYILIYIYRLPFVCDVKEHSNSIDITYDKTIGNNMYLPFYIKRKKINIINNEN